MNFKRLKLNRNIINQTIVGYLGQEIFPVVSNKTGYDIYRYNIDPESILDIYYNSDTTTTLCCTGKNPETAEVIAREIIAQCSLSLPNPIRAIYLKGFSQENFDIVLQNIENSDCNLKVLTDTDIAKRYEVTNTYNENIKIHYFPATGALNIQGKGYSAYNSILSSFDTLISLEEVIESNLRANNIENITTLELIEAMTRAFPNAYPFLNGVIANIISSSFFLTKIENEDLPDYSWMIFPMLRGLEGVIKKMLLLKGIRVDKHFGEVFEPISSGSTVYRLKGCHSATMDSKHSTTIEKCYNYFVANRHGIFHVNSSLSTTRQIRREEAIDIFNELVELIENSYLEIMS